MPRCNWARPPCPSWPINSTGQLDAPVLPWRGRVLQFLDGRAESPGESRSRVALSRWGTLPNPELQPSIFDEKGRFLARVDFLFPELGVIGEFDGEGKYRRKELRGTRTADDVVIAEKIREDALRALGWIVVRWTWPELGGRRWLDRLTTAGEMVVDRGGSGRGARLQHGDSETRDLAARIATSQKLHVLRGADRRCEAAQGRTTSQHVSRPRRTYSRCEVPTGPAKWTAPRLLELHHARRDHARHPAQVVGGRQAVHRPQAGVTRGREHR